MLITSISQNVYAMENEYLTILREGHEVKQNKLCRAAEVGDIVTIHNDKLLRQRWKLGKIGRLLPGKGDIVQADELLTVDKSCLF